MFKTTRTYEVSRRIRLDKVFPNGLPINAFIDKGRCAIGATYGEIMYKIRCTIIVVPNISILLNKKASHPELDIVYGDVPYRDVIMMFNTRKSGHKIMTTPEGIGKIMDAATVTGRLNEVYTEWFLLLDEAHTFISESYREDILLPFEYFWLFDKKSIISATPYVFTDKRFRQLEYHKIIFDEKLGTVNLINASSVIATLNWFLTHLDKFPGNLHIFYNSVTEIKNAILRAGLTDCNILCAHDEEGKNLKKLGELSKHFMVEPKTGEYKKVNFYTCKYFEGWDLYDDNATIILVTDYRKEHTKVGVSTKGKQAIGRLRNAAHAIVHITNHQHIHEMKPIEAFRIDDLEDASLFIKQHNDHVATCNKAGRKPKDDPRLIKFADINETTNIATLNLMKLDQQINEAANNEIYNHIDYIRKDWEDGYFEVVQHKSEIKWEPSTTIKRKSADTQLKEDYLALLTYKQQRENGDLIFSFGDTPEVEIKRSNPLAYQAYKLLDEETMLTYKYNVKKVQTAIILKENILLEVKLLRLLGQAFTVNQKYSNEYIKTKLQEIYTQLNIRDENGKIKTAKASELSLPGRFEVKDCKFKDKQGKECNGKQIIRAQFNQRMARAA